MPKRTANILPIPKKARNSLVAYVDGKRIVFGNYGAPVAWQNFAEFCEKRRNEGNKALPSVPPSIPSSEIHPSNVLMNSPHVTQGNPPLVADLVAAFLDYAAEAKDRSDYSSYKVACKALLQYSTTTTERFDACLLLQIQGSFVKANYARKYANKLVNFCIHIFKWGEPRRLCPPGKSGQLRAVEPLRFGSARETEPRDAVPNDVVEQTLPYLLPVYQAIIKILRETGARPCEILRLKVGEI